MSFIESGGLFEGFHYCTPYDYVLVFVLRQRFLSAMEGLHFSCNLQATSEGISSSRPLCLELSLKSPLFLVRDN